MLQFSLPGAAVRLLPPEQVRERAGKIFSAAALTGLKQPLQGLNEFILRHYGQEFLKNRQRERLEIAQYYVKCVK